MAKITVSAGQGVTTLAERELYKYSDDLKRRMLKAGGDVIAAAQREHAERQGLRDTGFLVEQLQARERTIKLTEDGGSIEVSANANYPGRRTKTNAAAVAAVYEYGSSKHRARPFIRPANDESYAAAVAAMDAVRKAAGEGE